MIALSSPPAVPRVAPSPRQRSVTTPPKSTPSSSSSHSISRVTHHPTPRPPSSYLFNAEGKKRDSPFQKYVCNFFSFFLIFFYFAECVCVLYILTLYKPAGCCNGGLGGWVLVGKGSGGLFRWGTMHKLYCVWIKRITYAYIFTRVCMCTYMHINK